MKNLVTKYKDKPTPSFKEGWKEISLPDPPKDSIKELNIIKKTIKTNTEKNYKSMHEQDREDFEILFLKIIPDKSEKMKQFINNISSQLFTICTYFKEKYQRPRPKEIADKNGIDFPDVDTDTAKSPAYPSGHTLSAYFLAKLFSQKFPEYKEKLYAFAKQCAENRVRGGVHYPSDIRGGKILAEKLFKYYSPSSSTPLSSMSFKEWFSL